MNYEELINKSDIIRLQGRFDDGLKCLEDYQINSDDSLIKAQRALILCEKGDYQESYDLLKPFLDHDKLTENLKSLAIAYHGLGRYYELKQLFHHNGDYNKAHEYFRKSLDLKKQLDDKRGITELLFRVGVIYERIGGSENDEKAIEFYKESVKIGEEFGQEIAYTSTLTHLAGQYEKKGDIQRAIDMYQKNLTISKNLERGTSVAWCYTHIGRNFSKLDPDIKKAISYYKQSIEQAESINFIRSPPVSLYYWARIYLEAQKYELALDKFLEALDYASKTDNKYIVYPCYSALVLTLTRLENYPQMIEIVNDYLNSVKNDPQYKERGLLWSDELGKIYLSLGLWLDEFRKLPIKDEFRIILNEMNLKESSEACFKKAIEFSKDRGDYYTLTPAMYELGKFLIESGKRNEGIEKIKEALRVSERYHLLQENLFIRNLLEKIES